MPLCIFVLKNVYFPGFFSPSVRIQWLSDVSPEHPQRPRFIGFTNGGKKRTQKIPTGCSANLRYEIGKKKHDDPSLIPNSRYICMYIQHV